MNAVLIRLFVVATVAPCVAHILMDPEPFGDTFIANENDSMTEFKCHSLCLGLVSEIDRRCEGSCKCLACPPIRDTGTDDCTESIATCRGNIPREGDIHNMAIFTNNSVYRFGDLLYHSGKRYRRDSLALLCHPRYRSTLLRRVLERTTTFRGESLEGVEDGRLERRIAGIQRGFSCASGVSEGGDRSVVLGNAVSNRNALVELVRQMLEKGECERPLPRDVVVNLRIGDKTPNFQKTADAIMSTLREAEDPQRIVLNGVLNFGGYSGYVNSTEKHARNRDVLQRLIDHFRELGYQVRVRSEPDSDQDFCYMAGARHLVRGLGGFGRLVTEVRRRLG